MQSTDGVDVATECIFKGLVGLLRGQAGRNETEPRHAAVDMVIDRQDWHAQPKQEHTGSGLGSNAGYST